MKDQLDFKRKYLPRLVSWERFGTFPFIGTALHNVLVLDFIFSIEP